MQTPSVDNHNTKESAYTYSMQAKKRIEDLSEITGVSRSFAVSNIGSPSVRLGKNLGRLFRSKGGSVRFQKTLQIDEDSVRIPMTPSGVLMNEQWKVNHKTVDQRKTFGVRRGRSVTNSTLNDRIPGTPNINMGNICTTPDIKQFLSPKPGKYRPHQDLMIGDSIEEPDEPIVALPKVVKIKDLVPKTPKVFTT